ncbi:DUF7210 family protein [Shouchella lehensis]|nr:hypothetical protein [Shouchella lehensis]
MAATKKKAKLTANIKLDDKRHKAGETISVNKAEYDELVKAGVVDEG